MLDNHEDRSAIAEAITAFGLPKSTPESEITKLRPFVEIVKLLPRGRQGKPRHVTVLHRWYLSGQLRTLQTGGLRATSLLWVYEFFVRRTAEAQRATTFETSRESSGPVRTSTQRAMALARAERELDRLGV